MKLNLRNEALNKEVQLKAGSGLYYLWMLIPTIGTLITMIISIKDKQFKIFLSVLLDLMLVNSFAYILILVVYGIGGEVTSPFFAIVTIIVGIVALAIQIYIFYKTIFNINYWSYNNFIKQGYVLTNNDHIDTPIFIHEAEQVKTPWWIIFI